MSARALGASLRFDPLTPQEYAEIVRLEASVELGLRWRNSGRSVSPAEFHERLWTNVLDHRVVRRLTDPDQKICGTLSAYQPSFRDGTAFLGVMFRPEWHGTGMGIAAVARYVDLLFRQWPLRKLYGEVAEFNYHSFASGNGRFFEEEGRLRSHVYLGGRHWDVHLITITRSLWQHAIAPLVHPERAS